MKFLKQEIKVGIFLNVIIGLAQNAFLGTGEIKLFIVFAVNSTVDREIDRKEYT